MSLGLGLLFLDLLWGFDVNGLLSTHRVDLDFAFALDLFLIFLNFGLGHGLGLWFGSWAWVLIWASTWAWGLDWGLFLELYLD